MAFSSRSGGNTSSTLFPLPTSHLHPIRKLYEFPSFDTSPVASASTSTLPSIPSRPSSSSYARDDDSVNAEIREGLERLDIARKLKREMAIKSAPPEIPERKTSSPEEPSGFYPVSYIRGEWMQKFLELELPKPKIRYFLSDETLCLGTPLAPITSEYSSGLTFYEAYTHSSNPESAIVYMNEEQVIWLIDELYSILGAKNSKLTYEDIDIDTSKKVELRDFKAIRKVSFRNNVAGFRRRCGIPIITRAAMAEHKILTSATTHIKQNWSNGAIVPKVSNVISHGQAKSMHQAGSAKSVGTAPVTGAKKNQDNDINHSASASTSHLPTDPTPAPAPVPKSFVSLTRAERQARLQSQREEALKRHLEQQRNILPSQRRFYRNMERYGGAALACDVESWTEDAEVLLELGMAWFVWTPSGGQDECMERDGGSCHYIIEETIQYRNEEIEATRWDYSLGQSETLPQNKVSQMLRKKIDELSKYGPLVLVFHDASAETRYFQRLGVDSDILYTKPPVALSNSAPSWPSLPLESPIIIIQDTQNLYAGWSSPQIKQINLGKACDQFGLDDEAKKLHNAGNDAFATLRVWEILLEMEENEKQSVSDGGAVNVTKEEDRSLEGSNKSEDVKSSRVIQPKEEVLQVQAAFPDLIELWHERTDLRGA